MLPRRAPLRSTIHSSRDTRRVVSWPIARRRTRHRSCCGWVHRTNASRCIAQKSSPAPLLLAKARAPITGDGRRLSRLSSSLLQPRAPGFAAPKSDANALSKQRVWPSPTVSGITEIVRLWIDLRTRSPIALSRFETQLHQRCAVSTQEFCCLLPMRRFFYESVRR